VDLTPEEVDAWHAAKSQTLSTDTLHRLFSILVLEPAEPQRMVGTRLAQATYHRRSLALYSKLGFDEALVRNRSGCRLGHGTWP
jgi:hypothetical protein